MEEEEAGTASLLCYALCLSLKLVCVCECVFVLLRRPGLLQLL